MADEVVIGGMTYGTYVAENDPDGSIGMALAEAKMKSLDYDFSRLREDSESDNGNGHLRRVTRVALTRFPELQQGERIGVREVKQRLGEIRRIGYDVKPYSRMNADEAWRYLSEIRADVAREARVHCPDVLDEVNDSNRRTKAEARDPLYS